MPLMISQPALMVRALMISIALRKGRRCREYQYS
jgi:hypothetical protein